MAGKKKVLCSCKAATQIADCKHGCSIPPGKQYSHASLIHLVLGCPVCWLAAISSILEDGVMLGEGNISLPFHQAAEAARVIVVGVSLGAVAATPGAELIPHFATKNATRPWHLRSAGRGKEGGDRASINLSTVGALDRDLQGFAEVGMS
jgi:hypothetical protein